MQEVWKDIKGYEGLYQISNLGNLRSIKNNIIRPIITQKNQRYMRNNLWKNSKYRTFSIHRLVAEAFIPNPNNYPVINHIDGDKTNNCVNNLEWCTQSYNVKESYRLGLQKTLTPPMLKNYIPWNKGLKMSNDYISQNYFTRKINQYDLNNNFIKSWDSISKAEKTLKITHISMCCRNNRNSAGGYIWRYADK